MRLAYLFALLATPAVAHHIPEHLLVQGRVPCLGVADAIATLHEKGFHRGHSGEIDGDKVEVWVTDDGRFMVVYLRGNDACFVQNGTGWKAAGSST